MSRLYHTLVILGGALVGCGANSESDSAAESETHDTEPEPTPVMPTTTEPGESSTTPPVGPDNTESPEGSDPIAPPNPADPDPEVPSTPTPVDPMEQVDEVSPETYVGQAPNEDCPSSQWTCGVPGCDQDGTCYQSSGNAQDPPCPAPVLDTCSCDPTRPISAAECGEGQTFTCLYGAFELPDGSSEQAPYDCHCLDGNSDGFVNCTDHPNGAELRNSSVDATTESELWCGNCAVPLIR